jgi:cytochrome P450
LHSAFSPTGVLAYESHVDHTVTELVSHLRAVGLTANLTNWGIWFAFDTVARVAFSEDQGFMRSRTDVGGAAEASRKRFGHWNLYWAIPWLDALLYKNWWVRRSKRAPSGMARLAMRAIARRAEKGGTGADNDVLGLLIRSSEKDPELYTPARIVDMTISTMQAGSETTGYTTAICLWHLLANPRVLARLRRELEDVAPTTADGWALPSASALRGTNYLEACVKESNRIRPTVSTFRPSARYQQAVARLQACSFQAARLSRVTLPGCTLTRVYGATTSKRTDRSAGSKRARSSGSR